MHIFEWDAEKDRQNIAKHGIAFRDAIRLFDNVHVTCWSRHEDNERYVSIGQVEGREVAVVWIFRGFESYRLISARRARHEERNWYRQGKGG